MWAWLFPYFIPVFCLAGPEGMLVPGLVGPISTEDAAGLMGYYLRYESGCETGELKRALRWTTSAPPTIVPPKYWTNIKLHNRDGVTDEQFMLAAPLDWREP